MEIKVNKSVQLTFICNLLVRALRWKIRNAKDTEMSHPGLMLSRDSSHTDLVSFQTH